MKKSKINRSPNRTVHETAELYQLLDKHYLCHVAFQNQDGPVNIPMMYGRSGNTLFIHGSIKSRLMQSLEKGIQVCLSIASIQGIVLARSVFNHSLNYESIVIFGKSSQVAETEKLNALKCITDHLIPGRWEEARAPDHNELLATSVVKIDIQEISGKIRTGDPSDKKADYDLDIWAGVLEYKKGFDQIIMDSKTKASLSVPTSVHNKRNY